MSRYTPPHISQLEETLKITFQNQTLLTTALTHSSAVASKNGKSHSYQRLEFLGDRILGLVVSQMLYEAFPEAPEGELSRRLAALVRAETCAEIAQEWDIGPYIRLGRSEIQTGGRKKKAILADICEAIIGAVYLEGGLEPARRLIISKWEPRMRNPQRPLQDSKTWLQEWAQSQGAPPPTYELLERSGLEHAPNFRVAVHVVGLSPGEAQARTKREAEQKAAENLIEIHQLKQNKSS